MSHPPSHPVQAQEQTQYRSLEESLSGDPEKVDIVQAAAGVLYSAIRCAMENPEEEKVIDEACKIVKDALRRHREMVAFEWTGHLALDSAFEKLLTLSHSRSS